MPPMAGWVRYPKPHKVPVDQGPWVSWGPLLPEVRHHPGTTVQHCNGLLLTQALGSPGGEAAELGLAMGR